MKKYHEYNTEQLNHQEHLIFNYVYIDELSASQVVSPK